MRSTSGESVAGFDMALWVEGSVEERSDAVAGFVQEAWENHLDCKFAVSKAAKSLWISVSFSVNGGFLSAFHSFSKFLSVGVINDVALVVI